MCCEIDLITKIATKIWSAADRKNIKASKIDDENKGKVCDKTETHGSIIRSGDDCLESDSNTDMDLEFDFERLSFGQKNILLAVNALCAAGVERKESENKKMKNEQNNFEFELNSISQLLIDKTIYSACRESLLHFGEILFNDDKNHTSTVGNNIKNGKNSDDIVTLLEEMKICEKNIVKADSSRFSLLSSILPIEISKDMDNQKLKLYRKVQSKAVKEIFKKYLSS